MTDTAYASTAAQKWTNSTLLWHLYNPPLLAVKLLVRGVNESSAGSHRTRLLGEESEPPPALVCTDGGGLFTMLESG